MSLPRSLFKKVRQLEKKYTAAGGGGGDKYEVCLSAYHSSLRTVLIML